MSKNPIVYEFHSAANLFPLMNVHEFEALKNDIALNGLREPVYLYQDKIIDGRNRYKACLEIGIEPVFRKYEGTEDGLIEFVLSLNLHRRHLSISQKACLAVESLPSIETRTRANLSKQMKAIRTGNKEVYANLQKLNSNDIASKLFGISERYVSEAKKLKKESESLFVRVKAGELTLQKAKKQLYDSEVSAKLQNLEYQKPANQEPIVLSKNQTKKVNELIEYGMPEGKAREYVFARIKSITDKGTTPGAATPKFKELKFRIEPDIKNSLQALAQQGNKHLSEFIRELLKKSLIEQLRF
ncbi:MAG: hypothetical protein WC389_12230 [Lutibacter sp.]|jgi:ParB-like chromosome segregation protein Spo0J